MSPCPSLAFFFFFFFLQLARSAVRLVLFCFVCFSSFFLSSFLSVAILAAFPFCCCFHPTPPHPSLSLSTKTKTYKPFFLCFVGLLISYPPPPPPRPSFCGDLCGGQDVKTDPLLGPPATPSSVLHCTGGPLYLYGVAVNQLCALQKFISLPYACGSQPFQAFPPSSRQQQMTSITS